jgi:hypothetical protein
MGSACGDCPRVLADCYRKGCITMDGVKRVVTAVNGEIPGPSIEVGALRG